MLICSAVLPPPVHGQALVNAWVKAGLINRAVEHVWIDTSPGRVSKYSLTYHLRRIFKVLQTVVLLLFYSLSRGRVFYTVLEAGWGGYYNLVTLAVARLMCYRIVLHHHTAAHLSRDDVFFKGIAAVAGVRCVHVVLTSGMSCDLKKYYGLNSIVVNNWSSVRDALVEGRVVRSRVGTSGSSNYCLGYISNISVSKGFLDFARLVERAMSSDDRCRVNVAGPVGELACENTLRTLQSVWPDRVTYWGPVGGTTKEEFFDSIDLLIFPTKYKNEAAPLVVLEALARGVPVLAYDVGYIRDQLPANWVFGDEVSLEEFLLKILERKRDGVDFLSNDLLSWMDQVEGNSEIEVNNFFSILKQ